ncbi:MAG: HAMP domain-containing histidine kinase [Flavobacteriales bacterium]|nr:HAMP domain-containing histidine kinase [Flavobacteriales bacterium]
MKLKLLFFLIIVYVIAGFGWWSYSLIKFSNNEYKLKLQLLEKDKLSSAWKMVEVGKLNQFVSSQADTVVVNDVKFSADIEQMNLFLSKVFHDRFILIVNKGKYPVATVEINPETVKKLQKELRLKKRSFAIEAILLTLLIATGIFGVYYSVSIVFDLNKQQNNFLLSVTHELKTPIAAIKLIGETMLKRKLPPEKQEELLGVILDNTTRLEDMTENMLTAMQMESNKYNIKKEELNLSEILENVKHNFALKNNMLGEIEEHISFYGDPVLLKMTINNLVENAIKYSDNKPVELNLYEANDHIIIEVKDQGIGIDPSQRKKIFKRFYRIQDEETRETKGSGLGLFIVKQAVEKHKGKIIISDNTPSGTVFTLQFKALD